MPRSNYSESPRQYENIRQVLAPHLRNRPSREIEAMFESADMPAEDLESFLSTLGNIGRSVVRAVPQVLPGVIQGATTGAALGPFGALGGALIGGVGSALSGQQRPPGQPSQRGRRASGTPQAGGTGGAGGAGAAANQLFQTMFRPETLQALMSMMMGGAGRQNVPVGNTPVPVGAFTNLLGMLANRASAEYNATIGATGESVPRYMENYAGEIESDPAVAENRAERLLEMLQETDLEQNHSYSVKRSVEYEYYEDYPEDYEDTPETDEQIYDAIELDEFYSQNESW